MKDKVKVELDRYELGTLINSLYQFRNTKIEENISVDSIDELLLKLTDIYDGKCPVMKALRKDYER